MMGDRSINWALNNPAPGQMAARPLRAGWGRPTLPFATVRQPVTRCSDWRSGPSVRTHAWSRPARGRAGRSRTYVQRILSRVRARAGHVSDHRALEVK